MSKITYVLDTSVLASDPFAFKFFPKQEIIIPICVIEELDKLKTFSNEAGKNARICLRSLDALSKTGDLHLGIKVDGCAVKVEVNEFDKKEYNDDNILACAQFYQAKNIKRKIPYDTILLSNDVNLRVRARAYGIKAEEHYKDKTKINELYTGFRTIESSELGYLLAEKNNLECADHKLLADLYPNECVYFTDEEGKGLGIGRKVGDRIITINDKKPWGILARSREQAYAIDLMLDSRVPLVSLIGSAGTGKTLIALASALHLVIEQKKYKKLIIFRPMQGIPGQEIGFLPGTMIEKITPHFGAVLDALEILLGEKNPKWEQTLAMWMEKGLISFEPLTFIRGRSLSDSLVIVEESQNLSKETLKTILTRLSHKTKVIFNGDLFQVDSPNLDAESNALTLAVEKFKSSTLSGSIQLVKSERSPLATLASEIL